MLNASPPSAKVGLSKKYLPRPVCLRRSIYLASPKSLDSFAPVSKKASVGFLISPNSSRIGLGIFWRDWVMPVSMEVFLTTLPFQACSYPTLHANTLFI